MYKPDRGLGTIALYCVILNLESPSLCLHLLYWKKEWNINKWI